MRNGLSKPDTANLETYTMPSNKAASKICIFYLSQTTLPQEEDLWDHQ